MPFASPEARRAYDRQRYAVKKGYVSNPGNGSSPASVPEFVPRQEKIGQFQPKGHRRTLASAQNWFTDHKLRLTETVIPLGVGVTMGFFGTLFASRYLSELPGKAKTFLASYLPRQNQQEQPVDSMQALYDYSLDVMRRQAGVD